MTWGHLRSLLGSCWGVLVPFLDVLEGSWRHLGVILGYLGGSWGRVGGILEGVWVKFMDILDTLWRNTCCKPFLTYFLFLFCMLSFCETLVFVAPVEVFEGFFNVRFLECKYCNPLKHT